MPRYCPVVGHGGNRYMDRTWHCNHGTCGGIQAWRHHLEEQDRDAQLLVLAEEHRWQRALGLPLTPLVPFEEKRAGALRRVIALAGRVPERYLGDGRDPLRVIEEAKARRFEGHRRRALRALRDLHRP